MEEEEKQTNEQQAVHEDATDYIESIKYLKENTVSKASYNKLQEEKKELIKALVDGQEVKVPKEEKKVDVEALRDKIFNKELTDLEYAQDILALRKAELENGHGDIFQPNNETPSYEDAEASEHFAEALQHCIETAQGNETIFENEFHRVIR